MFRVIRCSVPTGCLESFVVVRDSRRIGYSCNRVLELAFVIAILSRSVCPFLNAFAARNVSRTVSGWLGSSVISFYLLPSAVRFVTAVKLLVGGL